MNLRVMTSLLFVIPAAFTAYERQFFYTAVILASMTPSMLYHASNEKRYGNADTGFSMVLMGTNIYYLYQGNPDLVLFALTLAAIAASIYTDCL